MNLAGHILDILHTVLLVVLTVRVVRRLPAHLLVWCLGLMAIMRMVGLHTPPVGVVNSAADPVGWPMYVAVICCVTVLVGIAAWRAMLRLMRGLEGAIDWTITAVDMVNDRRRALRG